MATATTLVPLESYLATNYRPDCDWIDGELKARNMGEKPHSRIQQYLCQYRRFCTSRDGASSCIRSSGFRPPLIIIVSRMCASRSQATTTSTSFASRRCSAWRFCRERIHSMRSTCACRIIFKWACVRCGSSTQRLGSPMTQMTSVYSYRKGERLTVPATAIEVQVQAMFAALDKR